ncbi:MAG: heme o synthase [Phycisphaerales bacterium]|jgi:protoheme IX farnesyltransferase|nr:heme o synthase [Phycisphaerales bacterium]
MSDTITQSPATPAAPTPGLLRLYADLVKFRLSLLVVVTSGVGCIMASGPSIDWLTLLWTVLGTLACASAANAINQIVETRRDALMHRTRGRPIPSGAMSPVHGWIVAVLLGYGGVFLLAMLVNLYAAGLALLTLLLYVLAYTPLKPVTTFNTLIGAVVGGIPPLIGWVAVTEHLSIGGWILGGLLFVWQLPHFLSLAWLYREQYELAGFRMLPSVRGGENAVCEATLISTLLLIPLSLLSVTLHQAGMVYGVVALAAGVWFSWKAMMFYKHRSRPTARGAFLASLLYLPVLLLAMVLDRVPHIETIYVELAP